MIKDDNVLIKNNEIWDKLKRHQTKFHSMPVYDEKYIKVKVSVFNGVVNRNFFVLTTERWMKYQRKVCMTLA